MTHNFKFTFKYPILSVQLSITALFIFIAVGYSIVNPLFEAPDEIWHYEYVRWLKEGHGLAEPADIGHAPWAQEGAQPPLYYLLGATLISGISTENAASAIHYNPHSAIGNAEAFGNKNQMIHSTQEHWPWHGMALSAHLLRCFSILLGAITVLFTGAIARHLSQNPVIVATAMSLVAFNPQFLFISASVSNDNLVTALSTVALWLLLRVLSQDDPPTSNRLILLGALIGAVALSKLSGLLIIPMASLSLIWLAWQRRSSYELLRSSSIVGLTALAVAGWWYIRNWILFGDPLALNAMFAVLPARTESAGVAELIALWPGIWRSFWAVFGWFNIVVDEWVYTVYTFIIGIAALGLAFKLLRYTFSRQPFLSRTTVSWFLLIGWSAGITLLLVRWAQINYPQGRLLFPAIGAMMPLYAYGLLHWLPNRLQKYVSIVLCIILATIAIAIPSRWILPTYATNIFYTNQREIDEFKNVNFGNLIQLQNQKISPFPLQQSLHPGAQLM